jgi:phage shock protein PspC (stress-responsive transcriptional regulator)
MVQETISHYNYDEFLPNLSVPTSEDLDLMEREDSEVPEEIKRDNRVFWFAGILSLLAGIGMFAVTNFALPQIALPILIGAGILGLGVGMIKLFGKVLRRKTLNLPKLQLKRKTEVGPQNAMNSFQMSGAKGRLSRSETDKVFMGVCGGIAAHSGMSSALIRIAFIAAFAFSGGAVAAIYFALGLFLPIAPRPLPPAR